VLISNNNEAGISFWYPFARRGNPVRVIPTSTYYRFLKLRVVINIVLILFGAVLLLRNSYASGTFDIFAAAVTISTAGRLWFFLPTRRITVTRNTSIVAFPAAAIDFSGTFIALGIVLLLFSEQGTEDLVGQLPIIISSLFFIYAVLPLCAATAFQFGVGRPKPSGK